MIELNKNVVYVKGAVNGAIYNLNSGEVFAVNRLSSCVIEKYIQGEILDKNEQSYINLLISKQLINLSFKIGEYVVDIQSMHLNLCWLEITQSCNCKCIHCYEGETHKSCYEPLNVDEWKDVIDQLVKFKVKRVVVIGGEPCLYNGVEEILSYLRKNEIDTTIFTNGTCITSSIYRTIVDNKIRFKCSLYGHTAEVHDRITNNTGSFSKLINTIKSLKNDGVDITISVVIMRENEEYYLQIKNLAESLGVHYSFDVIREVFNGSQSSHLPCNTSIINSVKRTSAKFQKTFKSKFDLAVLHNTCWYGKMAICENGNVLPCVFERNIVYGNIRNESIIEIMKSQKLNECWNFTFDAVESCSQCEFKYACKDCRPLAISCVGMQAKNPRCTYDVFVGEWNGEK